MYQTTGNKRLSIVRLTLAITTSASCCCVYPTSTWTPISMATLLCMVCPTSLPPSHSTAAASPGPFSFPAPSPFPLHIPLALPFPFHHTHSHLPLPLKFLSPLPTAHLTRAIPVLLLKRPVLFVVACWKDDIPLVKLLVENGASQEVLNRFVIILPSE